MERYTTAIPNLCIYRFLSSIPRPEVVKRVRPEPRSQEPPKSLPDGTSSTTPAGDRTSISSFESRETQLLASSYDAPRTPREVLQQNGQLPREQRDGTQYLDQPITRPENIPAMPPPIAPSQTASAQELRETARQTMGRSDRVEVRNQNGAVEQLSRPRSSSPLSRPGTRNHSNDSHTSGSKDVADVDRSEREGRQENKESSNISRRDSLTHTRTERRDRGRDGEKDKDNDRDKERGRDRHNERERDKERDRDHRERDREREREREREKDRDRHRRDDKDRDRDSRKEREGATSRSQGASPAVATEDRGLPSRPDASRQDSSRRRDNPQINGDENLGKRRRPTEDEVCVQLLQ
jgi:THO complex subunit 2